MRHPEAYYRWHELRVGRHVEVRHCHASPTSALHACPPFMVQPVALPGVRDRSEWLRML